MPFVLFSDVILIKDLPEEDLKAGDVGTVVKRHVVPGMEDGYSVEVFDFPCLQDLSKMINCCWDGYDSQ